MNNTNRSMHISFKAIFSTLLLIAISFNAFSFNYEAYRTETAPVIDGIGNEDCWKAASWALINHPFDGKTSIPDSADFYGRYKVVWDASRVYVLMEITDDHLMDNRANPTDRYWDDDCAEFFFDEDNTPEGHECGANAFNAFAYHIAAVARDKNNYTNGGILPFDSPNAINHVMDLGSDCNTNNAINLDNHVKTKIVKDGNKYTWELEFKIFDKNYNQHSNNNIPVVLTPNKVMGFAIAYCDNDTGVRDNMIGSIPNHNDYGGQYPFYRFTNDFGTLTLNDSVLSSNTAIKPTSFQRSNFLWPNPVKDILNIKVGDKVKDFNKVEIFNLSGIAISSKMFDSNNAKIDVSYLPSETYIMQVSSREGLYKQLFIKE
jgi:hypothetical protein